VATHTLSVNVRADVAGTPIAGGGVGVAVGVGVGVAVGTGVAVGVGVAVGAGVGAAVGAGVTVGVGVGFGPCDGRWWAKAAGAPQVRRSATASSVPRGTACLGRLVMGLLSGPTAPRSRPWELRGRHSELLGALAYKVGVS
jgi:hypothetical protein